MAKITGHRFLEKDPIVDVIRAAMDKRGWNCNRIAELADVAPGTIRNIDFGETRRPQHHTTRRIMGACGYQEVWQASNGEQIKMEYEERSRSKRLKLMHADGDRWTAIHPPAKGVTKRNARKSKLSSATE